ncbi:MAG: hydantoinase/oxoprolinase family protein, partial [Anaerolineae bacterium]|nr:hydantoinase/oxoprolinase family protein [Anaerolineae bacterium]
KPIGDSSPEAAYIGSKSAPSGHADLAMYQREKLHPGAQIKGPALIFQLDSTTYVAEGWRATVDAYEAITLERG